jgi:hypothetical protein
MSATIHEVQLAITRLPATSPGTLRDLIEWAANQIDKRFKHVGRVLPMWHAETASETLVIAATFQHKDATTAALTELFRDERVLRYLFIDEAWVVKQDTGIDPADLKRMRKVGISEHPDRQEIVMISGEDANGTMTATREIIRPAKGKARLGPLSIDTYTSMESRFGGMLAHLNTQKDLH